MPEYSRLRSRVIGALRSTCCEGNAFGPDLLEKVKDQVEPSRDPEQVRDSLATVNLLVTLVGIEPTTSSMPWNFLYADLLMAKDL